MESEHSCLVLQQSCVPVCGQEDLHEQRTHRQWLRIKLPRNTFESLPTESNATDSRFCVFLRELPLFITLLSFSCDLHSSLNLSQQQTLSVFFCDVSAVPMSGWCKGDREPRYGCQPEASPRVDVERLQFAGSCRRQSLFVVPSCWLTPCKRPSGSAFYRQQ